MRLSDKWPSLIVLVLLVLGCGGLTWINAVVTLEDWLSHRAKQLEKVRIEAVRTSKELVYDDFGTRTDINLEMRVRRRGGEELVLTATFLGATRENAADINYLAVNKGREVELWIDQRGTGRFTLRREFSFYRFSMLGISSLMTLFFTWLLFRVLKA